MRRRVLPGFGLTLGVTGTYLGLLVLLPLAGLLAKAATAEPGRAWALFADPRTLGAFRVSFGASAGAALLSVPGACCSPGCWNATASRGAACWTRRWTCRWRCPPPSRGTR